MCVCVYNIADSSLILLALFVIPPASFPLPPSFCLLYLSLLHFRHFRVK